MPTVTDSALNRVREFTRPAVAAGLIRREELAAILAAARAASRSGPPAAPEPEAGRLLTLAEAGRRLSCCKKTVARLLQRGALPRVYLTPGAAKSLRVREADVIGLSADAGRGEA
jgi:hypothetical protein